MHLAKEIYFRFRENLEGENIISHIHSILRFMHFEFRVLAKSGLQDVLF